jgi:hypothetical protein
VKIAILDDYQNVALQMADWSPLAERTTITVFNDHVADPDGLVERLRPFEIVCVMRERTPLPRKILERLPHLKLIASTAIRNAMIWSSPVLPLIGGGVTKIQPVLIDDMTVGLAELLSTLRRRVKPTSLGSSGL